MPVSVPGALLAAAVLTVGVLGWRFFGAWFRFRGARLIECPENRRPAGVHVDGLHAAIGALHGAPSLRLSACSRWPERRNCGQECLAQVAASPESCLVRTLLSDWYRDKKCSVCGEPFGEIRWAVQQPGLISADKTTVEWNGIPAERLPEILETALPVCFACHMASTLVREHPELALDRGAMGARRISQ